MKTLTTYHAVKDFVTPLGAGRLAEWQVTLFGRICFGFGWAIKYHPRTKWFHWNAHRYMPGDHRRWHIQLHVGRIRIGILSHALNNPTP